MNSSDAAEAVVRMYLEGTEVAVKIAGSGAVKVAAFLLALSKDKKKTKGKTKLTNMIKSGSPLNIFSIKTSDLKKFHAEAKKYGVLYTVIASKEEKKNGTVDIMVRDEDASKVNRIVDKLRLSNVNMSAIKSEIEKDRIERLVNDAKEKGIEVTEERLANDLVSINKEKNDPLEERTVTGSQSENLFVNKKVTHFSKKKSVRATLKEIKEEINTKEEKNKENAKENVTNTFINKKSKKKKRKVRINDR